MPRPFDQIIGLDIESTWGRAIGLGFSCQTQEEYIRDPRFKLWGLSWAVLNVQTGEHHETWVRNSGLKKFFDSVDWSKTAVVAQNAAFDVAAIFWHHGVHPAFVFDTLSMGRALHGVEAGNSLKTLAERYGLPPKMEGLSPTENVLDELPFADEERLAEYCRHDTWLALELFKLMLPRFSQSELKLIDMTVKMYTQPRLVLDATMLAEAIADEESLLALALARAGRTESELASNDNFADVLRTFNIEPPMKPSPSGGGKMIYAFAKTDALFQQLLNGDNEDIALLCTARLNVKSTQARTRAHRFIEIAGRGPLPVPLNYWGAGPGRWQAAKGSNINLQNMKRGSRLRKAIKAPPGYVVVVGDLSQIEPRVLAYLADYLGLLEIFRSGVDAYAKFGENMFGVPGMTKDSHPVLRQSAKSALLGCFGADTPVLTPRGWVPIVQVQATDKVWDGQEWVTHSGLLNQGSREVLTAHGISATSDHEILTERGWEEWSEVLASPSLFQSALSLANSPVSNGRDEKAALARAEGPRCGSRECVALADGRGSLSAPIYVAGAQHAATIAPSAKRTARACSRRGLKMSALTARIASAFSIASARSLCVAQTRTARRILTTVGGALASMLRGWQTVSLSYATSCPSPVGTGPSFSWTASKTRRATHPAISASAPVARTWRTSGASARAASKRSSAASPPLRQRMPTYDIALAGPRNRYTILTDVGPIVVHNCGYMLGWRSFAAQLLVGFLGAPPKRYGKADAKLMGISVERAQRFINNKWHMAQMATIAHTCTEEELLIHCIVAKEIIDRYRETAEPVVKFWKFLGEMLERCLFGGDTVTYKCLTFSKGAVTMPNGMQLLYPELEQSRDERGRIEYWYKIGKKAEKLHPGRLCNNVTQGLARIVMSDGMLRVNTRLPVVLTVHDELAALARAEDAAKALPWVLRRMTEDPPYMPGIPLAADGGVHERYGEAKQ